MLWNVDTHMPRQRGPTRPARRSRISAAALFVNVMARISQGATPVVLDEVGNAVREHARLARAGAGEYEQRPVDGDDRLALRPVQGFDVDWHVSSLLTDGGEIKLPYSTAFPAGRRANARNLRKRPARYAYASASSSSGAAGLVVAGAAGAEGVAPHGQLRAVLHEVRALVARALEARAAAGCTRPCSRARTGGCSRGGSGPCGALLWRLMMARRRSSSTCSDAASWSLRNRSTASYISDTMAALGQLLARLVRERLLGCEVLAVEPGHLAAARADAAHRVHDGHEVGDLGRLPLRGRAGA